MDIPNLATNQTPIVTNPQTPLKLPKTSKIVYLIIVILAIASGFWISRFLPTKTTITNNYIKNEKSSVDLTKIIEGEELKIGVTYGNLSNNFSDNATGVLKSGGINGEGTHTLEREGGVTQNVALTSSVIDLDLFVGKKVIVKGETNKSIKAGWFMDVGNITIIE